MGAWAAATGHLLTTGGAFPFAIAAFATKSAIICMSLGQEGLTALVEVFQELGKVFQELFEFSKMSLFQVMKNAICVLLELRLGTC